MALLDSVQYLPYCDGLLFTCHRVASYGDTAVSQSVTIISVVTGLLLAGLAYKNKYLVKRIGEFRCFPDKELCPCFEIYGKVQR